jgi:hypothetical protein
MKDKSLAFTVLFAVTIGSAVAQTHISGTVQCAKVEPSGPVEVGDHPGHTLLLNKLSS